MSWATRAGSLRIEATVCHIKLVEVVCAARALVGRITTSILSPRVFIVAYGIFKEAAVNSIDIGKVITEVAFVVVE